jgi:hypothetical protein
MDRKIAESDRRRTSSERASQPSLSRLNRKQLIQRVEMLLPALSMTAYEPDTSTLRMNTLAVL